MSIIAEVQNEQQAKFEAQIAQLRAQYAEESQNTVHAMAVSKLQEKQADLIGRQQELAALEAEIAADTQEINAAFSAPAAPAEAVTPEPLG